MEVTLTQPRIDLGIQINSGEIAQNKQLNKSNRKVSKPGTHGTTSSPQLPTPEQQKTRGEGQTDPQITSW